MKNKPIILVAGEPNSIFFEILFKSLKKKKIKSPLVLICCKKLLLQKMKIHSFKKDIKIFKINKLKNINLNNRSINLIDVKLQNLYDKNNQYKMTKKYIVKSFNVAFQLIQSGLTHKFINGPIDKKNFLNKKFYGITEYISEKFKIKKVAMLIYNKKLSVCPVTTHLPIKLVAKKITKKLIEDKIQIVNSFFKKKLNIKPKIAVTGMNPHCETILKINEDEKIVYSAIKSQKKKRINVDGPFSADTIFLKNNREKFDVILGMYHDQVLGPFKTLFEYDAINITMGLPFFRVSTDHGPNKEMIKKNKSNPLSLLKALEFLDSK